MTSHFYPHGSFTSATIQTIPSISVRKRQDPVNGSGPNQQDPADAIRPVPSRSSENPTVPMISALKTTESYHVPIVNAALSSKIAAN